jgi:hypothetical protein
MVGTTEIDEDAIHPRSSILPVLYLIVYSYTDNMLIPPVNSNSIK